MKPKRRVRDYVGRDELKALPIGEWVKFVLPDVEKINSITAACSQLRLYRYKFTTRKDVNLDKNFYAIDVMRLK